MNDLPLESYAVTQCWQMPEPLPGEAWQALLSAYMAALARACSEAGPCLIGHLKALALFPDGGYLRVSTVSGQHPPTVDGAVPSGLRTLSLTVNLLVYGLPHSTLQRMAREEAAALAGSRAGRVSEEEIAGAHGVEHHHPHGEHPHPRAGK